MNELTLIEHQGIFAVDSREVAEMVDKRHDHLLRDINGYIEVIEKSNVPNLGVVDFFIPSTYGDSKGETRPCYLLTRKGCDMVANKMIGEKGVLFTAVYVTKFEQMEKAIAKSITQPLTPAEMFLQQAQFNVQQERKILALETAQAETVQFIQNVKEAMLPIDKEWRKYVNEQLTRVAQALGNNFQGTKQDSYLLLEKRAACNLVRRVKNLKDRLSEGGATKTTIARACKLDVIEADQRLKEIYTAIVREMAIKYVA